MKEYWEREEFHLGHWMVKVRADSRTVTCKFCGSANIVKNGITKQGTQNWLCTICGRSFVDNQALPKGKYPIENISSALYQYYTGSSLKDIRGYIEQQTGNRPSKSTVYSWIVRFSKIAIDEANKYTPKVGDTWVADETVLDVEGKKVWLFDVIDEKTRYLLASRLSESRTIKEAALVMKEAKQRAGKSPKRIITDRLAAYIDGIELVFGGDTEHIQSTPFIDTDSTNVIERFHGTLKDRTKVMRALKKPKTIIIDGFLVFYNYFRPHEGLGDKTPAEVAKISKFPFKNWLDVVKSQSPIVQTERILASLSKNEEIRLPFRVPYRKRPKPKHRVRKEIHQSLSIGRV
jgi:putative transposase